MRGLAIAIGTVCVLAVSVFPGSAAQAAPSRAEADSGARSAAPLAANPVVPPAEFGSDWDDPRIAAPPPAVPSTRSCTVRIVDHRFADFTPYTGSYSPPAACAGPWSTVVLRLDGAVQGRQYDRLGALKLGDVTILKTSTPEPSADGIRWKVEKDVTGYQELLRADQPVWMLIGNVVNDTYTGILDVQVSLTFYPADRRHPAADTADRVLPLTDPVSENAALTGSVTIPRDTERLLAEVYATGSGGGCEEFWYLAAPPASGYSCTAPDGPYREVQVLLDGKVAGIAAPYPHIYTGGWSNPFLWYAQPAPRAFDIQPLRYDLTPFAGLLTDDKPHRLTVRVEGVPAGQSGWDTPVNVLAWRDGSGRRAHGGLLSHALSTPDHKATVTPDGTGQRVKTTGTRRLAVAGWLSTSHGRVLTTVTQALTNTSTHTWAAGENPDRLTAAWTDTNTVTVVGTSAFPSLSRSAKKYTVDGAITVSPEDRLTTTITLLDAADEATLGGRSAPVQRRLRNEYTGEASWLLNVPREQRHATGTSSERYRLDENSRHYDKRLTSTNGYFTSTTR